MAVGEREDEKEMERKELSRSGCADGQVKYLKFRVETCLELQIVRLDQ